MLFFHFKVAINTNWNVDPPCFGLRIRYIAILRHMSLLRKMRVNILNKSRERICHCCLIILKRVQNRITNTERVYRFSFFSSTKKKNEQTIWSRITTRWIHEIHLFLRIWLVLKMSQLKTKFYGDELVIETSTTTRIKLFKE